MDSQAVLGLRFFAVKHQFNFSNSMRKKKRHTHRGPLPNLRCLHAATSGGFGRLFELRYGVLQVGVTDLGFHRRQ